MAFVAELIIKKKFIRKKMAWGRWNYFPGRTKVIHPPPDRLYYPNIRGKIGLIVSTAIEGAARIQVSTILIKIKIPSDLKSAKRESQVAMTGAACVFSVSSGANKI